MIFDWRTFKITVFVVILHGLVLYAIQRGLLQQIVNLAQAAEPISVELIQVPAPKPTPPAQAQPKPVKKVPKKTVVSAAKKPLPQKPEPQPLASKLATPEADVLPDTTTETLTSAQAVTEAVAQTDAREESLGSNQVSMVSKEPKEVSATALKCNTPKPDYPLISKRLNETGRVSVRIVIGVSGKLEQITLIQSSGFKRLDEIALYSVRQARCNPFLHNGQAIRVAAIQPFDFNLE